LKIHGYGKIALRWQTGANFPVHASKARGFIMSLMSGAGTLGQSLKAVQDKGIISVVGFPYNLGRTVHIILG
jgi:hypothetical protein